MTKLEFEEPVVEVIVEILPPVTLPLSTKLRMVMLSALITVDATVPTAMRITALAIWVATLVLLMVRLRLIPTEFGLSPSIVTLSAPFN